MPAIGARRPVKVEEALRASGLDLALAWAAVIPLIGAAIAAWLTAGSTQAVVMSLAIIWAGAVLAFLAGVRRGLSFGTAHGPSWRRIGFILWVFVLAFGSMVALRPLTSLGLLILGYASLMVAARPSAERGEVPPFFAHLRPIQMMLAVLSLCAVAARLLAAG
jgi:hypothetical protein